jgi:hypothetical protein
MALIIGSSSQLSSSQLNLRKTDNTLIGSVEINAGGTEDLTVDVVNSISNHIYIEAVLSGSTLEIELPDIEINIVDQNDNIINTAFVPVYEPINIDIDSYSVNPIINVDGGYSRTIPIDLGVDGDGAIQDPIDIILDGGGA